METIYLNPNDPAATNLIAASFPGCKLKQVAVRISTGGMSLTSYWSGGTRDYHKIIRLDTMQTVQVPENGSGFTQVDRACGPAGLPISLPAPGFAVVTYTDGSYKAISINIHPDNAAALIPAPVELTWGEKVVLVATRSLKSSYNGRTRAETAQYDTGITPAEWEAAKTALVARKLLNTAGAITTEGRNAAGSTQLYTLERK